ncbi:MAG: rhomboid family intramembrane serine protease, partial [Deltaproteobacteria bacterium]
PGINNWAHGGGIVSGLLLAFMTSYHERRRETPTHRIIGMGSIAMTAAVLLWAVIQAVYSMVL